MGFSQSWSFLLLIIAAASVPCTLAATYTVGGAILWTRPTSNTAYSTWAAGQTFVVGDILSFNFTTGAHDVVQVDEAGYTGCTSNSAIKTINDGPATVTLEEATMHYYICSIRTHCSSGQKVAINVTSTTSTTPPTATTPPTTNTTSPPPPPPSAAAPLAGVAAVSFSIFSAIISYFLYI